MTHIMTLRIKLSSGTTGIRKYLNFKRKFFAMNDSIANPGSSAGKVCILCIKNFKVKF